MTKKIATFLITFYQKFFSPDTGITGRRNICVLYPTCSEYAKIAIEKYGFIKGVVKSVARIFRCHPWQKNHIDVP
ncbi:MAG: membrane protein insertion efficiency factor YidD [Parcubacteria group bacterium]|nr:membrane protein insertion efficiency factor YidD [Parcubacteria group bacterium]